MVDPAQAFLAAVTTRVVGKSLDGILGPKALGLLEFGPGSIDATFTILDPAGVSPVGVVTQAQLSDIEQFLKSDEVASLVESYLLLSLISQIESDARDTMESIEWAFEQLADVWCAGNRGESWASLAPDVWKIIALSLNGLTDRLAVLIDSEYSVDDLAHPFAVQLLQGTRGGIPNYIREVKEVFRRPDRYAEIRQAASVIKSSMANRFSEMSMLHLHQDYRIAQDDLYVQRSVKLVDRDDIAVGVNELISPRTRGRVVIAGDPGVGKTTLVNHLVLQLARVDGTSVVPLVVRCRDYAAEPRSLSIVDHLISVLSSDYSLEVEKPAVQGLLALGSVCIVFDGVDEVLEPGRRREIIKRIESFSHEYPAVTVVATSRLVGYEEARFGSDFMLAVLPEFGEEQYREYVETWFRLASRGDGTADGFHRETESVADIRYNPLMLSLLCTLYSAIGYIPRNRRNVYKECADLLFTHWDSRRQIEQPTDHRAHGNYLMHEIALLYYTSQAAQSGLDKRQLTGVIASFFENTAGVEKGESYERAELFLKFCAGRAWLLSKKGTNSRGEELFGFTHRTFMEYYAAEALVRRLESGDQIADEIFRIFRQNPSSVLPDVLAQAYDDKNERGAERIFKTLSARGLTSEIAQPDQYLALCLRIVNACAMSHSVTRLLPATCVHYWAKIQSVDGSVKSSRALFELHRDARAKILAAFDTGTDQSRYFEHGVLCRWVRFEIVERTSSFEQGWRDALTSRLEEFIDPEKSSRFRGLKPDPLIIQYLMACGKVAPGAEVPNYGTASPVLVMNAFGESIPGPALSAFVRLIDCAAREASCEAERTFLRSFSRQASASIPHNIASDMVRALRSFDQIASVASDGLRSAVLAAPDCASLILWIGLCDYEINGSRGNELLKAIVDATVGRESFRTALVRRRDGFLEVATKKRVRAQFAEFGKWAAAWFDNRISIVRYGQGVQRPGKLKIGASD